MTSEAPLDEPRLDEPRRRDRAVSDPRWIEALLRVARFGVLGGCADGRPHLNPNLFAYDAGRREIYFHTARTGATPSLVGRQSEMAFCAMRAGRVLPAPNALDFSIEYASVVVRGRVRRLTDRDPARRALQALLDKYAPHLEPGRDYRPIQDEELARTAVYALRIRSWSGKREPKRGGGSSS